MILSDVVELPVHRRNVVRRALIALVAGSVMLIGAGAQEPPQAPSSSQPAKTSPQMERSLPAYEGQTVSSVELAGRPNLDERDLLPLLKQKAGEPFSTAKINETVAALVHTGQFKTVQLLALPDLQGVRVLFILQPGYYFGVYEFPGALGRFPYSRLLQVANYPPEGPFTTRDVERAQRALSRFLSRSGYFESKVEPEVQTDPKHGIVNVSFHTTLGRRAKFGKVILQGATPEQTKYLEEKLHSILSRLRGSAIREGSKFSLKTLQNATQALEKDLASHDRLAAQVKLVGAAYDPATNHADITYHIDAGPLVKVKVEGAYLWSWDRHKLIPLYQDIGVDQELIQEGRTNLVSYFESKGYFNVKVNVNVVPQQGGEVITYQIVKGPRNKVADVGVAGNRELSSDKLVPQVTVKKGGFLSHGRYSEQLVHSSVKNLENLYKAAGFSTVKVTPQVKKNDDGNLDVTFRVNEGPRDIVEALRVEGNTTVPDNQLAPKGLKVVPGQPYSQQLVDADRTAIVAHYYDEGYLTATFRATVRPINKDPHRLEVTYIIYEGPRVVTDAVYTLGRKHTRQSYIDRETQLKAGTPLRSRDMLAAESRLYQPEIFDWAEVDPRRQITTQSQEDVVVKVHEAKRNSIIYGFGFEVTNRGGNVPSGTVAVPGLPAIGLPSEFTTNQQTFWGPRGTFQYTRLNLRGKAETLSVAGLAGRLDQRGSITYQNPHFRMTNWTESVTISGEHDSRNPIFTSRIGAAGFQFQHPLNRDKTTNFFLRYNFSETGITRLLIPELIPPEDLHTRLSTFALSFIRDTRDSALDAHKGILESAELDLNPKPLGSNVSFGRLLGQTAYYKRLPMDITWANSIRVGFELPFGNSHVPISEVFFSGGGSTLRGFPLDGAGPQNTVPVQDATGQIFKINVPAGGPQLFIFNSEFRIPIPADLPLVHRNLGVVPFYDGGNVFPHIGFHGQYTNTIGIGLRYKTPVGPVRIDVGHNLNSPGGIKATQYFITLGQAF